MLQYHLAVMCSEAQRRAPFLECDFIVGNIAGDSQPDELVEAGSGQRWALRQGARERLVRGGHAVDLHDRVSFGNARLPLFSSASRCWFFGRRSPALAFLSSLLDERCRWFELKGGRVVCAPESVDLARSAAARLARAIASDAIELQLQDAAAAAEVAYALAPREARDADLYKLVASAYSVSGRYGPVSKELFEPTADRSSRDLIPNIGDFLA
jgi:hypothetical protein